MNFNGQKALVIGASGGIGRATTQALSSAGAQVIATGRSMEKLQANVGSIKNVEIAELDILNTQMIDDFFANREPFDHIVITAAAFKTGSVTDLPLEDAYACMESKFWGAYKVARVARITDRGSLTFVTGFLAQRPNPGAVLLGAVNGGIEALARGLALEKSPVRVNCVSPGLTDTPLYAGMPDDKRSAMFEGAAQRLPARKVGQAEDIAAAILFVAANTYTTGTTVTVDGGGTIA